MDDKLYSILSKVCSTEIDVQTDGDKRIISLGRDSEHGFFETYSVFPGVILAFIDIKMDDISDVFAEENIDLRLLEINHCSGGRYAYAVGDDELVYFGKGDLCVSLYNLTKSVSDMPLGYYSGLELFVDVDVANDYVKQYMSDFDLIEFYEDLERNNGYVLVKSNEAIEHVIGELYGVDKRIQKTYYQLKTIELLLFFSIAEFKQYNYNSLSFSQAKIVEYVHNDLMNNLDSQVTLDELAEKYSISKTSLKNSFKEVYGKPIMKWRKEYKLDYSCELILKNGGLFISFQVFKGI